MSARKMAKMRINVDRSYLSALQHFLTVYSLDFVGSIMTRKIRNQIRNVKNTQTNLLSWFVKRNSQTRFGIDHKFSQIKNREDFVRLVPISTIADQEDYIQMIKNGNKNVLTLDPITCLGVTSGTSGKSSLIPSTRKITTNFFLYGIAPLYHAMVHAFPQCKQLQRTLKLMFRPKWRFTDSGLRIGPTSSNPNDLKRILHMYTTPMEAYSIYEEKELTYLHLLFAMMDETVGTIETNFISSLAHALVILHEEWDNLVNDIEKGRINESLDIPDDIRYDLESLMTPDPERANELREAYRLPPKGLLKRIWPDMQILLTADTGAFEVYRRLVLEEEGFGLRTYSPIYAATEGIIGVNIWPLSEDRHYLLLPGSMFFEFIPIEDDSGDQARTLFIEQVEVGKLYELVVTTTAGLYRHRLGDVVRIARKEGQCPVVEYMHRIGTLLNVRGEKMSEKFFYQCLADVMDEYESHLVDYCCVESPFYEYAFGSARTSPPRYHVFFEAKPRNNSTKSESARLQWMAKNLDRRLSAANYVYASFCGKGSIGEPILHRVKEGGFLSLRSFLLSVTDAGANQLKIPRVLRRKDAVIHISQLSRDT